MHVIACKESETADLAINSAANMELDGSGQYALGLQSGPDVLIVMDSKRRRKESDLQEEMDQGEIKGSSTTLTGRSSKNFVEAGPGVGARRAL